MSRFVELNLPCNIPGLYVAITSMSMAEFGYSRMCDDYGLEVCEEVKNSCSEVRNWGEKTNNDTLGIRLYECQNYVEYQNELN